MVCWAGGPYEKTMKSKLLPRLTFLALFLIISASIGYAQDVIVTKDGSTVLAKVLKITKTEVTYKKHSNLQGPDYTMSVSDIVSINYENGTKETFNPVVSQTEVQSSTDIFTTDVKTNDLELLRSYKNVSNMQGKIKKRRMIGWIGGGALFAVSGALLTAYLVSDGAMDDEIATILSSSLAGAGVAWCVGWNISANRLKKKLDSQYSQIPLFEQDIFNGKNSKLVAGVDALKLGDINQNTYAVGVSLKYNF